MEGLTSNTKDWVHMSTRQAYSRASQHPLEPFIRDQGRIYNVVGMFVCLYVPYNGPAVISLDAMVILHWQSGIMGTANGPCQVNECDNVECLYL